MKIIDLTQTLMSGMRGFESKPALSRPADGWNASSYTIYSHAGTHMDAQPHFDAGDTGIDRISPGKFISVCRVVDLSGIAPKTLITTNHLGDLKHSIRNGEGLLLRTDWYKFSGDASVYRNSMPRLSEEIVLWCIEKKISLIGVETPSVADVNNIPELTHIHTLLLRAGILIVEGLINLSELTAEKVLFIALPLKIRDGDGSPCRAIAVENFNELTVTQ